MPMDKRTVESGLVKKGFTQHEGDHHRFVYYWAETGKKSSVRTHTSHGAKKDISDNLIGMMARQCKLSKNQFSDLINCPLSREEYEKILQGQGLSPST